jgi:tetratricopeptide (TPR) repeat protein
MAEGDALVRQRRPGEAIGVYRNAARQSGGAVSAADKIANAEAQRLLLLESCETGDGDSALRACEAAWLPGARDEAALFERRGYLLQLSGQLTGALDAYMAAARLRPADRSVAQAIVTLSDRSGRNDAATLSAQGQALLTLGRPTAALLPLRRALMLSPTLAEARSRLRIAERRAEIRTAVVAVPGDEPAAVVSQPPRFTNEQPLTRSN